jgi:uncharacterized membrane protein
MANEQLPEHPHRAPRDDVGKVGPLLRRLEDALLRSEQQVVGEVEARVAPAWQRETEGEHRWQVSLCVVVALTMQLTLAKEVIRRPLFLPSLAGILLPSLAGILLVALVAVNPRRINRRSSALRIASIVLIASISLANASSAGRLVTDIVQNTKTGPAAHLLNEPTRLLLTGGAIWLTNVVAFALWYWELDRGGPVARANAIRKYPDFLFAQMQSPELAPDNWEPAFADYLYLSFTNAAAFSPTDVLPLSRWAKLIMLVQSAVSLSTVALIVARAVNAFG